MKKILGIILLLILIPIQSIALDRCKEFVPDIRSFGIQYNGLDFPWWYNVGCAMTESSCRGDVTSFDSGYGLYQFTGKTGVLKELQRYIPVDPYNTHSSIRAQSYYIMLIRTKKFKNTNLTIGNKRKVHPKAYVEKCGNNLADVFRYYNAGYWFFYESERGGFVCDNKEMKKYCVRGGTWVGSGKNRKYLNFCDVNYSYPEKVYNYSQPYKMGIDGQRFWYDKKKVNR